MKTLAAQKSPRRISCPSGPMNKLYVVSSYLPSVTIPPRGAGGAVGWSRGTTCGASLTSALHSPGGPSRCPPSDGGDGSDGSDGTAWGEGPLKPGAESSLEQPHAPFTTRPAKSSPTSRSRQRRHRTTAI